MFFSLIGLEYIARRHSHFLCFWPAAKCNWRPLSYYTTSTVENQSALLSPAGACGLRSGAPQVSSSGLKIAA